MTYIDLINRFWDINRTAPFSMAETTLYFFLLNEANRNRWKRPVGCATAIICASTGMSKSTLMRARKSLMEKGLISYTEGVRNSQFPVYTILVDAVCDDAEASSFETTHETSHETTRETSHKTSRETSRETYIKDKDIDKEIDIDNGREKIKREKLLSHSDNKINIDKLEELLVADEKWQQQIMLQLADSHADLNDKEKLRRLLHRFFNYLRICHVDMKEESDCRAHFFNKLTKEYLKAPAETKPKYDPRRPVEIFPDSPQDYYSSF